MGASSVVAALAVLSLACGCESSAPASTTPGRLPALAYEWTGTRATPLVPPALEAPMVPKGTWVLHIGDSFVHASLQQNLRGHFQAAGTGYVVDATTATYTTTWATDPDLDK